MREIIALSHGSGRAARSTATGTSHGGPGWASESVISAITLALAPWEHLFRRLFFLVQVHLTVIRYKQTSLLRDYHFPAECSVFLVCVVYSIQCPKHCNTLRDG